MLEYRGNQRSLAGKMDFSCVQSMHSPQQFDLLVDSARKYHPACVVALPSQTDFLIKALHDVPDVRIAGVVGFPSGGETTSIKRLQTIELLEKGCRELDMVINLSCFKAGDYTICLNDITEIVMIAEQIPVKVIIETPLLTADEICIASELVARSGAAFIKTATGWNGATTPDHVRLIRKTVGDTIKVKAAGGIRTIETIAELEQIGCDRYGVGIESALNILQHIS